MDGDGSRPTGIDRARGIEKVTRGKVGIGYSPWTHRWRSRAAKSSRPSHDVGIGEFPFGVYNLGRNVKLLPGCRGFVCCYLPM